jgi:hypothetical protein
MAIPLLRGARRGGWILTKSSNWLKAQTDAIITVYTGCGAVGSARGLGP